MPYLARKRELSNTARDGQSLAELGSTYDSLSLFGEDPVRIDLKSVHFADQKNRGRLSKGADVNIAKPPHAAMNAPRGPRNPQIFTDAALSSTLPASVVCKIR